MCLTAYAPLTPAPLAPMGASATAASAAAPRPSIASDAEILELLEHRVGERTADYGIVVGVVEAGRRRVVSVGNRSRGDGTPLDGDTLFEIGSITKVFTALLLAEAVQRGEVSLEDPVAKLLPAGVKVPARGGREITLLDLSTQSSGLPRLPNNLNPKEPDSPYADYSVEQLYAFLSSAQLSRDVGSKYEYSNLGVGLLGHALALRAGQSYEQLVHSRISGPLVMPSTVITLTAELRKRLAPGHLESLQPATNWDLPTLAGAGALRSSVNDLLTFLAAASGSQPNPLAPAFALCTAPRRPTDRHDTKIGLGWHISSAHGKTITWHNGGTGGYRSFIAFDPERRVGVALLSNVSTPLGPDDIGMHLLDPELPLASSAPLGSARQAISLDPQRLERYVGRYRLGSSAILAVTREGAQLFAQLSGQERYPSLRGDGDGFLLQGGQRTAQLRERRPGQSRRCHSAPARPRPAGPARGGAQASAAADGHLRPLRRRLRAPPGPDAEHHARGRTLLRAAHRAAPLRDLSLRRARVLPRCRRGRAQLRSRRQGPRRRLHHPSRGARHTRAARALTRCPGSHVCRRVRAVCERAHPQGQQ